MQSPSGKRAWSSVNRTSILPSLTLQGEAKRRREAEDKLARDQLAKDQQARDKLARDQLVRDRCFQSSYAFAISSLLGTNTLAVAEKHENLWTIDGFSTLEKKEGFSLSSPVFEIGVQDKLKTQWRLLLYPSADKTENQGYVSLFLQLERSNFAMVEAEFEFWFSGPLGEKKFPSGSIAKEFLVSWTDFRMWGRSRFVSNEQVLTVVKDDQLRVFCDVKIKGFGGTVLDIVGPKESLEQFWNLYSEKKHTDFIVKVEGKEYLVHKVILASKSSVFSAMFEHDMAEKASSVVTITDCKPKAIECFIEFVYRGSCEGLEDIAAELLALAEKYDVKALKAECEVALSRLLAVDTAAKTLVLAHNHNASFLKHTALLFINRNIRDVMDKDGWAALIETPALIDAIVHMMSDTYDELMMMYINGQKK